MPLRFDETMSGEVAAREGSRHFEFTARAVSDSLLAIVGWRPLVLEGTATLEGAAERAELLPGSRLEIGLPLHRYLRYQVHFRGPAGDLYRFFGEKTVSPLRPLRTMTTLEGRLFRNGAEVGRATLRFKLRDLPAFLGSFRTSAAALGAASDPAQLEPAAA